MKIITLAAAGALALPLTLAPAAAQVTATPAPRPATISVGGEGSIVRAPDEAVVTFSIVTNDDAATRATSANNVAYNALVAKLSGLGLGPSALKTTSYNVAYNQRPPQPNPQYPQRYGYVVTRNVTVTMNRTDQVGAVIDAGVEAGVTNVGGVSFGLHDNRAAYRAALAAAVADADAQARAVAEAAHVRLGRIVSIGAPSFAPIPRPISPISPMAAAGVRVPTDVQPSDLTVRASVGMTYEIAR